MTNYRIFNYDLKSDQAFWLSIVNSKYNNSKHRYRDNDKIKPHGYISYEDSKIILGKKPNEKIKEIINEGYIELYPFPDPNKYGNQSYGFIPLIQPNGYRYVQSKKFDRYYKKNVQNLSPEGKIIYRNLHHAQFDLDAIKFKKLIYDYAYPAYVKKTNPDKIKFNTADEYYDYILDVYDEIIRFNSSKGKRILDFISEDEFGNRVHTIISNVPAILRRTILIDGEETCEIDLSQSQPSITSSLLKSRIGNNTFSDTVENLGLYEFLQEELELNSREEAKNYYFAMAYGSAYSDMAKKMYDFFPETREFLIELKQKLLPENPNSKKKKKLTRPRMVNGVKKEYRNMNYTNFVYLIQQEESRIFRNLWNELNMARIKFLTVHDSVIVKKQDQMLASMIMETSLKEQIHPNIKLNIKQGFERNVPSIATPNYKLVA